MKVLVTGANGFVGSHLVERLLKEGLEVICLVRPSSDLATIRDLPVEIRATGLESVDAAAQALDGADLVIHVAGRTRARSADEYMAANAEPTRRLVEAALAQADKGGQAGRLRRFVYVSSLAAVGPNPSHTPFDENHPPAPADDYGRSKLAGERIVMAAAGRLPVTIVRPPGVYGPRDTNFLPLFRAARSLGLIPSVGNCHPRLKQYSLVHAEDLADGIWLATSTPAAVGQTYFITSGTNTMIEFAEAMSAAIRRPARRSAGRPYKRVRLVRIPTPLAVLAGEFGQLIWALTGRSQIMSRRKVRDLLWPRWTCSSDKAARELDYRPRFGLADGLRQTALWYAAHGWIKPIGQ